MHNLNKLRVYQTARSNLRAISGETQRIRQFGDLKNQIERAALSVVSNIAEGAGSNTDANFIRFLGYARASNKELLCQLEILNDLERTKLNSIISDVDHVGAMLYRLMQKLSIQ